MDNRVQKFRHLVEQGHLCLPGVFNGIAALSAKNAGFKALYISGAGLHNSMGLPDTSLLSQSEFSQLCSYISRSASPLPCIADADTGFGEEEQVSRTVQLYLAAGLAGMHIEDQQLPKRCGHLDGKKLISKEHMCSKIRAAREAADEAGDFYLIARCDARENEGVDLALERCQAYLQAGADAIFPEALHDLDEFKLFSRELDCPLLANLTEFGKTPVLPAEDLFAAGAAMIIWPMTAFRVQLKSLDSCYQHLQQNKSQLGLLPQMRTRKELYKLLNYQINTKGGKK